MNFECMNCSNKTHLSIGGNISVICQVCGCADVKFDQDIGISPVGFNGPYEIQSIKAGEPFLGRHKDGLIWKISLPPLPKEEPKVELPKVELPKEEPKKVEKVTLKIRRK